MAFKIYSWTDEEAPVLNTSTSGSLCRVLSASLVAGYGTQTSAGWACPFSGSNVMVFQQPSGSGFYLRVDDRSPNLTGREARVTGYETMTSIDTGSGQFPLASQVSIAGTGSLSIRKSFVGLNVLPRAWHVIADEYTFYMLIHTGDQLYYTGWMFGDIYSFVAGDAYKCMLVGRITENQTGDNLLEVMNSSPSLTLVDGHYLARAYSGLGGSIKASKHGDGLKGYATDNGMAGNIPFPNPVDGSFWLSPIWVAENSSTIRGKLRGIWQFLHTTTQFGGDRSTLSGSGPLGGKTFRMFQTGSSGQNWAFESSDTVPVSS